MSTLIWNALYIFSVGHEVSFDTQTIIEIVDDKAVLKINTKFITIMIIINLSLQRGW